MIRVGVIGYGYWGPNLARNFADVPGATLAAVCDPRPDRLERAKTLHPLIQTFTEVDDLLKRAELDAVAIATPVHTHYDLAMQCLQAGKHIWIEKPVASTARQAEHLVEEADHRGLVLLVDHTFIYTGAVRKIKELIDNGSLGELYYYDSVRVNLGLFHRDVNVLWDLAVHDLAILDYLIPLRPTAVTATGTRHVSGHPENIAHLTLFYPNTFVAHVQVNWLSPVKIRKTLIGGSKQMVVYDDVEPTEKVRVYQAGVNIDPSPSDLYKLLVSYRTGDIWTPQIASTEALKLEAQEFARCINEKDRPINDGVAGMRLVRILEAATASLKGNNLTIPLSL